MKVLVVDDNQENRYLLEQELGARGFSVRCANNGVEALNLLGQSKSDLIISDILMPEMDGFQLCYALKRDRNLRGIPLIFYTATYTDSEDEALGLSLGAEAYILKPAEPAMLYREIDAVFRRGKEHGFKTSSLLSSDDEVTFLKQYSGRVVRKLENKVEELQQAKAALAKHARDLEHQVAHRTAALRETVAELEAFSYSVAHDMRAPLRAMQGFATMLEEDHGEALGKGKDYLHRIQAAASRLEAFIQEVLNYSKMLGADLPLRRMELEKFLAGIIEAYPNLHEPEVTIKIDRPLPPVLANASALTQVVSNILGNAVKFVTPGKKPEIRISAEKLPGDQVRISFQDNGIGIAPDCRDKIFLIFQRLNPPRSYDGTGIGLAIVKKAVERMGGKVGVESVPGNGSRFWIELGAA